jgi:putative heme-binding domain-containing protein
MILALRLAVVSVAALMYTGGMTAADQPASRRVAWTTSRIHGSPEPPTPYRIARAFPHLNFKNPLLLANAPGATRLFVGEQAGKLFSFPNDPACSQADLFLDLTTQLHRWPKNGKIKGVGAVYGLAFHPQFAVNRYCYICYVLDGVNGEQLVDGSRVSRFRVTNTDPPRCEPDSEKILIAWMAGGHNGGCLQFGPDGYLYISTGDAADPSPPDRLDTGQDLSDLLSSILRIDVDHEDPGKAYAVPADNPFRNLAGARPEIWAYGFRNPWRMSFDRATGDLWAGDVGWELWEMVYHVRKGGNYGWSVMEGRQPVRPESKRGPTPILPPALDFPHSEAASITGGYVYRGKKLKDLVGTYICGDWMTRKLWGTRFAPDDRILRHEELARGTQRIVAFGEDNDGELYFLDYNEKGAIFQIVPNEAASEGSAAFPTKLSETGLYANVPTCQLAPGVVPYSINAQPWIDHATAERCVGLPGTSSVRMFVNPVPVGDEFFSAQVFFPKDGVLAKTLSLEMERGNPLSQRRLETQILHFDGTIWHGYTYAWNDEQTDATLVPAGGAERTFKVIDHLAPGGRRTQTWRFQARAECLQCHNPWAGGTLGFTVAQLNRQGSPGQLSALRQMEMIVPGDKDDPTLPATDRPVPRLADPYDVRANLDDRARSYLHVNCSHCHQFGAGGTAEIDLRWHLPMDQTKTLEVRPVQGTFEIHGAHILSPGDPYRSVLYYRLAKLGPGRMPHIGSSEIDDRGVRLIHDWIRQLAVRPNDQAAIERLRRLCGPTDAGKATERAEIIQKLLSSTGSALLLARALDDQRVFEPARSEVLNAARNRAEPQIRDLFERYLPEEQRVKRLGSTIKPEQILTLKGNAGRGKELFFKSAGTQCVNCHRIAGTGSTLGPDLSQIGKKYSKALILENILEPSKSIDPKYLTYLIETKDGQVHTGLLADKTPAEVVLRSAADKETRIPTAKVETMVPQKNSIMPEQLLRDLTAQQVADLLEFLASLK